MKRVVNFFRVVFDAIVEARTRKYNYLQNSGKLY